MEKEENKEIILLCIEFDVFTFWLKKQFNKFNKDKKSYFLQLIMILLRMVWIKVLRSLFKNTII